MSQYQIFISYRRLPSSEIAKKLFTSLETKGYSVFFDRTTLQAGSKFLKRIDEAIDSCRVFIVFLSKETMESNWVHHEVSRALSRTRDDSLYVIPIISDNSSEEDYYPRFFRKKDINGGISFYKYDGEFEELNKAVINALESRQVYPAKATSDSIKRIQHTRDNIKAIPELISGVINECKDCPRYSAKEGQIRCPFLFSGETSDKTYLDTLASLRVPVSKQPEIYDYSFSERKSISTLWNDERDAIKNEFRIQIGDGHLGCSHDLACELQRQRLIRLQKALSALNQPIYQTDLDYLSKRIKSLSSSLKEDDLNILNKLDISELPNFILCQVQRCWHKIEWDINYLVKRNGYDSLAALILGSIHESTELVEHAVKERKNISTLKPFLILWWLLRQNSSILTKAILSNASPTIKKQLVHSIELFLAAYQELNECPDCVQFERAFQFLHNDVPAGMKSSLTNSLCLPTTDYKWINIKDNSDPYFSCAKLDNFQNPIQSSSLFLAKCVNELEFDNIFTYSDEDYTSIFGSHKVYAVDYLYPLSEYCLQLNTALRNKEKNEIDLYNPTPKIINLLETNNFNVELLYIPPESFDPDSLRFTIAAYDNSINVNNYELLAKEKTNPVTIERVHNSGDLSSIIYLANLIAYGDNPDYKKAILLYEKAISMGACFCMYKIAQCFEILHNYRLALWWYSTVDEESVEDKETLYLRIGTCCYHLNEMALCHEFYDKAGAKGQAAKYKYELYTNVFSLESISGVLEPKSIVFNKAMGSLFDEVKPRLGLFDDLHDFQFSEDETIDLAQKTIEKLQEKALEENDSETQYKLGLYDLEAFITSEVFFKNALNRIRLAAINGSPHALCLMGLYMERFRHNTTAANQYYSSALNSIFPDPFPDITKLES